jgi:signal transduction histidine kinase
MAARRTKQPKQEQLSQISAQLSSLTERINDALAELSPQRRRPKSYLPQDLTDDCPEPLDPKR